MMAGIGLISDLAGDAIRLSVYLFFVARIFDERMPERKDMVRAAAGMWIITILVRLPGLTEYAGAVLETVWLSYCAVRMGTADKRLCLFLSIFYEIGLSLWQFLLGAFLGLLFQTEAFLNGKDIRSLCPAWILYLMLFLMAWYVKRNGESGKEKEGRLLSWLAALGLLLTVTLSQQKTLSLSGDILNMWETLAVILLLSIQIFRMRRQYEMERELAELRRTQARLLERDYTALNRSYEIHAKLFHDFRNHMSVLQQMLSHEKYTEALRYLEELKGPLQEMTDRVWTGDETADCLINQKAAEAVKSKVRMEIRVEYPRHTNIQSADLCAILGNLLDNALEAARKVPDTEKRMVCLTIRRIHQMIVIKVENYFAGPVVTEHGEPVSTKKEKGLHGWGLKSARTALERYDGILRTVCEGDLFRAVATMNYEAVDAEGK